MRRLAWRPVRCGTGVLPGGDGELALLRPCRGGGRSQPREDMEHTHLDPTRGAPACPPEAAIPGSDHRAGPTPVQSPSPNGSAKPAATGASDLRVLGEHRILRRLGEGGMGAVYLGHDGKRQV